MQDSRELSFMCLGAFCAIAGIGGLDALHLPGLDPVFLVGSLGASAVIVFGTPDSPMARARNVFGGQMLSAIIGVTCFRWLGTEPWLSGGLAVALAIFAMHRTGTLHAPGGATALIANIGSDKVKALGYGYVIAPVLTGVMVLMAVAFLARWLRSANYRELTTIPTRIRSLRPLVGHRRRRVASAEP
jgi:CBS domain-containing membrane protein